MVVLADILEAVEPVPEHDGGRFHHAEVEGAQLADGRALRLISQRSPVGEPQRDENDKIGRESVGLKCELRSSCVLPFIRQGLGCASDPD